MSNNLGRASGLSGKSAATLIGMLVPIVFGVIRRVMRTASDRFDIAGLLASQQAHIAAALPEGLTDETYTGPRVATGRWAEGYREEKAPTRSNWSWILPLALVLGGLGLIWNWGNRNRERAFTPPATVHAGREEAKPRTMVTLDSLKTKYKSVLDEARAQGVQISDLREKGGKLIITGTAPSQEAANKVWDEIKRVNPSLNDITADFKVAATDSSLLREKYTAPIVTEESVEIEEYVAPVTREKMESSADSSADTYRVKPGDTLTSISKHFYGTGTEYERILDANRSTIDHKDLIRVGQELTIPMK